MSESIMERITRVRAELDAMSPSDVASNIKGNPFIGDTPEQTMRNVCGVLRVLELIYINNPQGPSSSPADHEHLGWFVLLSGMASALKVQVEHDEKRERPGEQS